MEEVRQLVSLFYTRKGIVPLDGETLIQFALQHCNIDGSLVQDIEVHFDTALKMFTAKTEKKILAENTLSLEPTRDLTGDERLLYTFFTDYCTRNRIKAKWVADWQHVCDNCDEKTKDLIEEYLKGKLGTISSTNRLIGGDRVLIDFRIYTSLDEKLRWDKFFCPGLSNEDLLRILVARHGHKPKPADHGRASQRGGTIYRENRLKLATNFPEMNLEESVWKFLMTPEDSDGRTSAYKSIRVTCTLCDEIDPTSRSVYNVLMAGYESFVVKGLEFRFIGADNLCEIQFCVLNDKREVRLGPAMIQRQVTLRGFMVCEKFFCVVFSQNVSPHGIIVHAEILVGGVGRDDQRSKGNCTSIRARPTNVKPQNVVSDKPHTPPIPCTRSKKVPGGERKPSQNDNQGMIKARCHIAGDDVPKNSGKSYQKSSARSICITSAGDISCIAELINKSISRTRVCFDWLDSGDCPIGINCPYFHP